MEDLKIIIAIAGGAVAISATVAGSAWRLGGALARLTEQVTEIKTNDLPHLEERLERVEQTLIDHLVTRKG